MEATTLDLSYLSGGQIYDLIGPPSESTCKIATKIGNAVIKAMKQSKIFTDEVGTTIVNRNAKKVVREAQRIFFDELQGDNLETLRRKTKILFDAAAATSIVIEEKKETVTVEPTTASLTARVMHLSEPGSESFGILSIIFGGDDPHIARQTLDNKDARPVNLWQELADIFNSVDWSPENLFGDDDRLRDIDPRFPPSVPWDAVKLRKSFNSTKTEFSTVYEKYHASGNLVAGDEGEQSDEFEKFIHGQMIHLYLFKYWRDAIPSFCIRLLPEGFASDTGAPGSASKKRTRDPEDKSPNKVAKQLERVATAMEMMVQDDNEANRQRMAKDDNEANRQRMMDLMKIIESRTFDLLFTQEERESYIAEYRSLVATGRM